MKIWIDGNYYSQDDAKISVFDHGLLYGDGLFEGIRIYNGKVFKLEEHITRLYDGAHVLMITPPYSHKELCGIVNEAVKENKKTNGYIRLLLTRGKGDLGVSPFLCSKASVVIIVGDIQLYPAEYYEKGISVITSSIRRIPAECFDVRLKSLNYLNNVLAKIESVKAGCLEAILLNTDGYVAECTGDNIFIVKNGTIITPASTDSLLEGITRNTVLEIAQSLSIPSRIGKFTQFDLYTADECFLTGTGAEVIAVTSVDHRVIGSGKQGDITKRIGTEFKRVVNSY